jgi:ribose-phosphate pyrophosphokinase
MKGVREIAYPDLTFHVPKHNGGRYADESPRRGRLLLASCRSGSDLAQRIHERYQSHLMAQRARTSLPHLRDVDRQFSDSETVVRLDQDVNGHDVYLVQCLRDPTSSRSVDENYLALLIAARALREWGASNVTVLLPYLAYARQDKPTRGMREPTTARLMADLAIEAGVTRVVTWHPHIAYVQGLYDHVPVDQLDATHLFVDAFADFRGREEVIVVAPDAGAIKFVTRVAEALDLSAAAASKLRPSPGEAVVSQLLGDFSGKEKALVVDDMIAGGGTIEAVVEELTSRKGIREVHVGVSHNLCLPEAIDRLDRLHRDGRLHTLIVTNSVPQTCDFLRLPCVSVRDLSDVFSRVINRIHHGLSVSVP